MRFIGLPGDFVCDRRNSRVGDGLPSKDSSSMASLSATMTILILDNAAETVAASARLEQLRKCSSNSFFLFSTSLPPDYFLLRQVCPVPLGNWRSRFCRILLGMEILEQSSKLSSCGVRFRRRTKDKLLHSRTFIQMRA